MVNYLKCLLIVLIPLVMQAQVKYDTLVDNCHFYCKSDSLTIKYKGIEFYKSEEKISHWYYSNTDDLEFSPKMVDIDCDGKRELVYTRYSRGLHCCLGLMIWSFKDDKPQLLYQHEYKDQGGFLLKDIDGDCSLELLFADDSWAYWKTDYSRSPSVGVELKLINGKYNYYNYTNVIADSLRHHKHDNGKSRSSFSEQYLDTYYDKVNKIREASGWMDYKLSDLSGYWEIILRLLGFGYTEEAYCFSLDAWNSTYNNYDNFMKQFNDNLYSSKHIGYLELKNPELRKYFK